MTAAEPVSKQGKSLGDDTLQDGQPRLRIR
jgi:hypothetical protein